MLQVGEKGGAILVLCHTTVGKNFQSRRKGARDLIGMCDELSPDKGLPTTKIYICISIEANSHVNTLQLYDVSFVFLILFLKKALYSSLNSMNPLTHSHYHMSPHKI